MELIKNPKMKTFTKSILACALMLGFSCQNDDDATTEELPINTAVNFQYKTTIAIGGEGAAEISAYDAVSQKLFVTNSESNVVSVYNIENLDTPVQETAISLNAFGAPNSVATYNGKLAVAVEAPVKQNLGKILVYNATNLTLLNEYTVGALPDMVTFSKDGNLIVCANEGEPNDDYTIDPEGSVSIINLSDNTVTTLDFEAFNLEESTLEAQGFRVFGPGARIHNNI